MYNSDIKMQFINQYSDNLSTRSDCISIFSATQKYEELYNADLYQFTVKDLQATMDDILGVRARSGSSRYSIIKKYINWCVDNNLPGATTAIYSIDLDGINKLRTRTVKNPIHLQIYLDQICDSENEHTITNTYRCYYWLAYAGMAKQDIIKVRSRDVDLSTMTVEYNHESYPIYREAIPAFLNCIKLNAFTYIHPAYTIKKNRVDGDILVRGVKSTPSTSTIKTELTKRGKKAIDLGKTDLVLSYSRVWLSGIFYRMYERELAGFPVDFSGAASFYVKTHKIKCGADYGYLDKYQRKVEQEYRRDYIRWKKTLS